MRVKKYIKRIISVICAVALFIGCGEGFRYILIDDTNSYTRITLHQLYNAEENIDILFVGSSHVYRSIIPKVADEIFGAYTFNAGTSSQQFDGSYAMIQEAVSNYDIKQIYLEMYYDNYNTVEYKERMRLTQTYIISDYMRPSIRKWKYMLSASSQEHYSNTFIPARRNWEKFFDSDYVRIVFQKKSQDSYKNYQWIRTEDQTEYYVDRGFVANDNVVDRNTYWNSYAYGKVTFPEKLTTDIDFHQSWLSIVNYCKKNGVELTLFVTPEPEWTIVGKGNYQEYVNMIRELATENDLKFYDFNLVKAEYFDANNRNLFKDEDHLNTNGAKQFSALFAKFFTGQFSEEDLFYATYDKKLAAEEPRIYGVAGPHENKDEGIKEAYIISNRKEGIEYKIEVTPTEGEKRTIQEFSENIDFTFPIDETGTMTIYWRTTDKQEDIHTIEFEY